MSAEQVFVFPELVSSNNIERIEWHIATARESHTDKNLDSVYVLVAYAIAYNLSDAYNIAGNLYVRLKLSGYRTWLTVAEWRQFAKAYAPDWSV